MYVVPEISPRQDDGRAEESDWSELEKSQTEEEDESELEELSPRVLWRSPQRKSTKSAIGVVDVSSPRKQRVKNIEEVIVKPKSVPREMTLSDSDSDVILRL